MKDRFVKDLMTVKVYENKVLMGEGAAADVAAAVKDELSRKETINMIYAAAPSQSTFLSAFTAMTDIPWERTRAFHMDEYTGLSEDAPQRFGNFLRMNLFSKVPFREVYYIDGNAPDADAECRRYAALLEKYPVDIVCLGIGENGHIAFNDPGVADFGDPVAVKVVPLDDVCRQQQVNDGCFATLQEVPTHAITLTIPALTRASSMFCIVPSRSKAPAVSGTVNGLVCEACPASILRRKENSFLYLDSDSSSLI